MIKKIVCAALLPIIFSTNVNAEEVKELKLTLQNSIEMALKSNLDLAVEEYNPEIQRLNVQKIRDEFGLYLGLAPQLRNNVSPTSNSFISGGALIEQFTQNYGLYLKKRFAAGGELSFNFDNAISSTNSNRVDFNPAFAPGLSLSFTQPILRNAFNGSRRIMIGENQTKSSEMTLKTRIISTIYQTKAAYWDVVAAKLRLDVLLKSLSFSEDLLKVNQERLKAGFASKVDIINAETVIATRQESVYQIRKDLGDAEDRLKRLINPDEKLFPNWRFNITATDSPVIPKVAVDTDKSFETAINRPDYQISLIDQQNIEIQKEINNQNRLPTLNLTSSAGLQSLDRNYFSALGNLFGLKGYFWNVGLAFEVPIQGNVGETEFRQSLLNEKRQEVVLD
ncbi:TolC family protein, partial [bacterium]